MRNYFLLSLFFITSIQPEEQKPEKLNLQDVVKRVIESNALVQNAKLEIVKADSGIIKSDSKYVYNVYTQGSKQESKLPFNQNQIFSGTKVQIDRFALGVEKELMSGTYFRTEVSTLRFDNNAFENPYTTPSQFAFLGIKPLNTGAVSFKISQELMKYSFGRNSFNPWKANLDHQERKVNVLKKQAEIQRETIIAQLIQIITGTLIEYWSLTISNEAVETFQKLKSNVSNIKKITYRKQAIGISERFEDNQWSALEENFDSQVKKAELDRDETVRRLKRILGVDPRTEVSGVTDLQETLPKIDLKKDIEYALVNRIDLKNLKKQIEIAKLSHELALDEDSPSLKLGIEYSSRAQSFISSLENFYIANRNGVTNTKFPEIIVDLDLSYPLWDVGVKRNIKDTKKMIEQLKENEKTLEREIKDEMETRYEAIISSFEVLDQSKKTKQETEKFYEGIYNRFTQGKIQSINLKNSLDALARSELGYTQAKINFNINLIRYDLTKNYLFDKYQIDVYDILEKLKNYKKE
jgi:outer membrane protein TolC